MIACGHSVKCSSKTTSGGPKLHCRRHADRATPPSEPNKQQKALHQSLSKLSGEAFDRKFTAEMVKDHKKEIAEYKKMAKKQNDPSGAYASQTLPTLQKHLEMAQSLTKGSGKTR